MSLEFQLISLASTVLVGSQIQHHCTFLLDLKKKKYKQAL